MKSLFYIRFVIFLFKNNLIKIKPAINDGLLKFIKKIKYYFLMNLVFITEPSKELSSKK